MKSNISAPTEKNVVRMDETDETVFVRSVRRLSTVLGAPQPGKLISFFRAAIFEIITRLALTAFNNHGPG